MSDLLEELEAQLEGLQLLEDLKKEINSAVEQRKSFSSANIPALRLANETSKSNLKSDVKKASAFVKKIRSITSEGLQQCIRDTESLNLTLYISEIVSALLETNYKPNDVPAIIRLCISLHHRYDDFTQPLLNGLQECLLQPFNEDEKDAGRKKRIQIRLIVELFEAGIYENSDFFLVLLRSLVGRGTKRLDIAFIPTYFS